MEALKSGADTLFILLGAIMVLAMHAGFAFLELGTVRRKSQVNALVKILTDFRPRAVVVAWDAGWSGREKVYEPYKAQRKSRPDLLKEQWPHLAPLSEAFGFANVRIEGWEADDVIASMTHKARAGGIPVMVVTGDRDAYQLVGDGVRVMSTSRGVTDTKIYDREGVIERYGVAPELVVRAGEDPVLVEHRPAVGLRTELGDPEHVLAGLHVPALGQPLGRRHHVARARVAEHGVVLALLEAEALLRAEEACSGCNEQ